MLPAEQQIRALLRIAALARTAFPINEPDYEGLEPNAQQVLLRLALSSNDSTRTIAEELALKQGTVASAVRHLEWMELISQSPDPANPSHRRRKITKAGSRMIKRILDRSAELELAADPSDRQRT